MVKQGKNEIISAMRMEGITKELDGTRKDLHKEVATEEYSIIAAPMIDFNQR